MTDSRTQFFSRWNQDRRRREMLRGMKIWMKELSKHEEKNTQGQTERAVSHQLSGKGKDYL
jgi:hypothetical protein